MSDPIEAEIEGKPIRMNPEDQESTIENLMAAIDDNKTKAEKLVEIARKLFAERVIDEEV